MRRLGGSCERTSFFRRRTIMHAVSTWYSSSVSLAPATEPPALSDRPAATFLGHLPFCSKRRCDTIGIIASREQLLHYWNGLLSIMRACHLC